jgi:hypothetical protein
VIVFRSQTLLIVGAGASKEAGLPTGDELKKSIVAKLTVHRQGTINLASSDDAMHMAYMLSRFSREKQRDYWQAASMICRGMVDAKSIDAYIHAHKGNEDIEVCGKLAIVQSILEAERRSAMKITSAPGVSPESIDQASLSNTWYEKFFRLLHEDISVSELDKLFDNVSIISFNYDRCIEHFLYHKIQNYYGVDAAAAANLVPPVIHPYGAVGPLPWRDAKRGVAFGYHAKGEELLSIAMKRIVTFTESFEDSAMRDRIETDVGKAETVIFLGFGFHRQNMDLLTAPNKTQIRNIFATAVGVSDSDLCQLSEEVSRALRPVGTGLEVRNKLKCGQLFDEYQRSIAR